MVILKKRRIGFFEATEWIPIFFQPSDAIFLASEESIYMRAIKEKFPSNPTFPLSDTSSRTSIGQIGP